MLCNQLKSVPTAEILTKDNILERIEFETPQIVYLFHCWACNRTHSLEFSAIDGDPIISKALSKAA